jgi:hypothetical protein
MGIFEQMNDVLKRFSTPPNTGKTPEDDDTPDRNVVESLDDVIGSPFHGALVKIPKNRTEVYQIYGRPVKDTTHASFPKAKMVTAENLPGSWNNAKPDKCRLYMLGYMEEYLREALSRSRRLGVLDGIETMGAYNHRHQRHDPDLPLSYHSWGCAVDINSPANRAKYKSNVKIHPPFSRQWMDLYPDGVPWELVLAFKSVGFTWGGDWGYGAWREHVLKLGAGYDAAKVDNPTWKNVTYVDPMHFELVA